MLPDVRDILNQIRSRYVSKKLLRRAPVGANNACWCMMFNTQHVVTGAGRWRGPSSGPMLRLQAHGQATRRKRGVATRLEARAWAHACRCMMFKVAVHVSRSTTSPRGTVMGLQRPDVRLQDHGQATRGKCGVATRLEARAWARWRLDGGGDKRNHSPRHGQTPSQLAPATIYDSRWHTAAHTIKRSAPAPKSGRLE